jgi:DNA-binding response OmpR family regulator
MLTLTPYSAGMNLSRVLPPPSALTSAVMAGVGDFAPAVAANLESAGVKVVVLGHAAEMIERVSSSAPDLILLGEDLDVDPSLLLGRLREAAPAARILFLLGSNNVRRAMFLVGLGVDDIILPPHSAEEILFRAQLVPLLENRGRERSWGAEAQGRRMVDRFSRTVLDPEHPVALTVREFQLLERLLDARGQVVSRETLLHDIWGEDQEKEAVLDATIHRLRHKLEVDPNTPKILVTVRGVGYRVESSRVGISESASATR